jgi:hypothetical protein
MIAQCHSSGNSILSYLALFLTIAIKCTCCKCMFSLLLTHNISPLIIISHAYASAVENSNAWGRLQAHVSGLGRREAQRPVGSHGSPVEAAAIPCYNRAK